ncbi:MAG: CHASE2 domain-containing protein [Roseobacter sp.]
MAGQRLTVLPGVMVSLIAVAWVSALAIFHLQERATWLDPLENRLLDLRYQLAGPIDPAPNIVIVAIDDATLEEGQTGIAGRARLAQLIGRIGDSGARAIILDVLLADAGSATERALLAAQLARVPTVIAAAARFDAAGTPQMIWPHEDFRAQSQVGLVNLSTDENGTPRYIPMFVDAQGALHPSIALLAALTTTNEQARINDTDVTLGSRVIPLDTGGNMPLRILGPSGTVPTISATRLMDSALPDVLGGKLVVLGFTAAAMGDRFNTPFDAATPGVEIIAMAVSQLIGSQTLRQDASTRKMDAIWAAILVSACFVAVLGLRLGPAVFLTFGVVLLSFAAQTVLFAQGLLLSAAMPIAATLPPVVLAGAMRLNKSRRVALKSERSLASLRRFQSPTLARRLEENPDYLRTPQAQDLVIFFVDLTGFTTLSQQLGPDGTSALLRQFHGLTSDAVEKRGGTVINYMGDGALAVFGLDPFQGTQTEADAALNAAHELEKALAAMRPDPAGAPLASRIGLHIGPVILSRLGAANHEQVSVSGDTVNLTSRLMEVAKAQGASIAATRDFIDRLSQNIDIQKTTRTKIAVRGRSGDVEVVLWPRQFDV